METSEVRDLSAQPAMTATRVGREIPLDARNSALEWRNAAPVTFCVDWRGQNDDPERQTEVRILWTLSTLYLRFACHYRELFVFEDSDANGRRDHLWDRDVAEAFLQPDPSQPSHYKEFEVSPNGLWIDLDIGPSISQETGSGIGSGMAASGAGPRNLQSGMARSVWMNDELRVWEAEMAIPMRALTASFDPAAAWRANFFRVEGVREPRFYSAWRATRTPQPDFHVPKAFGSLQFV
jgi:alpha-galactosidase